MVMGKGRGRGRRQARYAMSSEGLLLWAFCLMFLTFVYSSSAEPLYEVAPCEDIPSRMRDG